MISLTDDLLSGKTVKAINDSLRGRHTQKFYSSQLSYYSQVEYQQALLSSQITTYFPPVRGGTTGSALRRERLENPLDFGLCTVVSFISNVFARLTVKKIVDSFLLFVESDLRIASALHAHYGRKALNLISTTARASSVNLCTNLCETKKKEKRKKKEVPRPFGFLYIVSIYFPIKFLTADSLPLSSLLSPFFFSFFPLFPFFFSASSRVFSAGPKGRTECYRRSHLPPPATVDCSITLEKISL
jgi:hypothetical protein